MTTYPAWTPAPRPGIIPLHPLSFGTILGRSFAALRQNPRVLLGFALCVQAVAYIVVIAAVGAVAWASFSRLDTLPQDSEEFDTIMAGSIAVTAIAGIVLGLAAGALGVIVQGVVVAEVAHAAVAEKLTLGALWRKVKPIAWRLLGYSFLLVLAVMVIIAIAAVVIVALGTVALWGAVGLGILAALCAIPLTLWLTVKLLLAPAVIILEHATIGGAIARSWTLTRGRFWPALGIVLIIALIFGGIAQVVGLPFQLLSTGLSTVIAPTGDPGPSGVIALVVSLLLAQAVTLLIQSVAVVVQSTSTALIYLDCRMRREGLDLDLLAYVERRDAGVTGLPDPYRANIGRAIEPRYAPPPAYPGPPPPGFMAHTQHYPGGQAGWAGYPQGSPGYPAAPAYPYGPPQAAPDGVAYPPQQPAAHPAAPAGTSAPDPAAAPDITAAAQQDHAATATRWTAPEVSPQKTDPESPWR